MNMPTQLAKLVSRVMRIDPNAAEYIKKRFNDGEILPQGLSNRLSPNSGVSMLFTWITTPQGFDYWSNIHARNCVLPDMTAKENIL